MYAGRIHTMNVMKYLIIVALVIQSQTIMAMNALAKKQQDVEASIAAEQRVQKQRGIEERKRRFENATYGEQKLKILLEDVAALKSKFEELMASSKDEDAKFEALLQIFDELTPIDNAIAYNLNGIMIYQITKYRDSSLDFKELLQTTLAAMLTTKLEVILADVNKAIDIPRKEALEREFDALCRRTESKLPRLGYYPPEYMKTLDAFITGSKQHIRQAKFNILQKDLDALQSTYENILKSTNNDQKLTELSKVLRQTSDLDKTVSNLIPWYNRERYQIPKIQPLIDNLQKSLKQTRLDIKDEELNALKARYTEILNEPDSKEKVATLWKMNTEANMIHSDVSDITGSFNTAAVDFGFVIADKAGEILKKLHPQN